MFARVDHIGVAVDDLDAALALYGEVLERGDIDRIMDGVAKVDHRRVPPPSLRVAATSRSDRP